MKFSITLKDPDAVIDAIQDTKVDLKKTLNEQNPNLSEKEFELLVKNRMDEAMVFANEFLKWGEYITIDFDTEQKTATVRKKD